MKHPVKNIIKCKEPAKLTNKERNGISLGIIKIFKGKKIMNNRGIKTNITFL